MTVSSQIINAQGQLTLFKQHGHNIFKPFLLNTTIDVCSVLNNGKKNNFLIDITFQSFKNSNIWRGCPLKGYYFIENFYFGPNPTKSLPFPLGTYRVNASFFLNNPMQPLLKLGSFLKVFKTKRYS